MENSRNMLTQIPFILDVLKKVVIKGGSEKPGLNFLVSCKPVGCAGWAHLAHPA